MGFKEPVAHGRSPQPSKASYAWREKGNAACPTHSLKKCTLLLALLLTLFCLSWISEERSHSLLHWITGERLLLMAQMENQRPLFKTEWV